MPKDFGIEIEKTGVWLSDAESYQCRWITRNGGRGEFMICGLRVRAGSAYCDHHHAIVWRRIGEGRSRGPSKDAGE